MTIIAYAPPEGKGRRNNRRYEVVGYVGVDSGLVMLADPCQVLDEAAYKRLLEEPEGERTQEHRTVVRTASGDGIYPVIATVTPEGAIIGLYIDLDPYGVYAKRGA